MSTLVSAPIPTWQGSGGGGGPRFTRKGPAQVRRLTCCPVSRAASGLGCGPQRLGIESGPQNYYQCCFFFLFFFLLSFCSFFPGGPGTTFGGKYLTLQTTLAVGGKRFKGGSDATLLATARRKEMRVAYITDALLGLRDGGGGAAPIALPLDPPPHKLRTDGACRPCAAAGQA